MATRAIKNLRSLGYPAKLPVAKPRSGTLLTRELYAARHSIYNARKELYGDAMQKLIQRQIGQADREFLHFIARVNGKWAGTRVTVQVQGLNVSSFLPVLRSALSVSPSASAEALKEIALNDAFVFHPEHYILLNTPGVVETWGTQTHNLPTRTKVSSGITVPGFITPYIDSSYSTSVVGAGKLYDNTTVTYVLQQFKDTDGGKGLAADLQVWYPASCPRGYLENHAEHYTVEFRNGLLLAANSLGL